MSRVRALRLLTAVLAVYELRSFVTSAGHLVSLVGRETHSAGSVSLWLAVLLALGTGLLLRQVGYGLSQVGIARRWRPRLAGLWLLSCCVGIVLLSALRRSPLQATDAHLMSAAGPGWGSVGAVAALSLLFAVSVEGGGWLLRSAARAQLPPGFTVQRVAHERPPATPRTSTAPAPLRAGWSDRGPPSRLLATV